MRPHRRSPQPPRAPGADAQIELGRHEARPLFQLVDGLVEQVDAPQVDALVLDGSMDVVVDRHRSGIDVALGLPLLEALPVSELRALLLCALAATRRRARGKRDSNVAVESAGEAAGSVVVATALVRRALVRHVLDEDYWPAVFHGTQSSAHPHVKPFSSLRRTLRAHVEAGALRASASRLFAVDPAEDEPSLAEQLRILGVVPLEAVDAALLPVTSPATELLGHAYESILARLDARWCERVDAWWETAHEDALRQVLGEQATPARVWTQATALAHYSESLERAPTRL